MVKTFKATERVFVKCDVRCWMKAYIVVVDHPYHALTDGKGQYTIAGVPAGKYQVEFWHEELGKDSQEEEISGGAESKLDLVFPSEEE